MQNFESGWLCLRFYSIGEFAELIDVSTVTLRNWERRGLLLPHHKSSSGYRYYSEQQLQECLQGTKSRKYLVENEIMK